MRKRMSWDWVGDYPVFVYTTWLGHKVFNVDIIIGTKGNQNAGGTGPRDKPTKTYIQNNMASKNQVVTEAFSRAAVLINKIKLNTNSEIQT